MSDINIKVPRALTVQNVIDQEFELLQWGDEWVDAFGNPEFNSLVVVWGQSGNGKGSFLMKAAKELSKSGTVYINDLEEGGRHTFKQNAIRYGLANAQGKVLVRKEDFATMDARLKKRRSPEIVIINTAQYLNIRFDAFLKFQERHAGKQIWVFSQEEKGEPTGTLAKRLKYHADLKIYVKGFKAFSNGRTYGKTREYTIWEEGAAEYWGKTTDN